MSLNHSNKKIKKSRSLRLGRGIKTVGLMIFVFWSIAFLCVSSTKIASQLDYQVASRLEFYFRDVLRRSPGIDPRIKIFGYDDQAVAAFGRPEMTLNDWSALIRAIAARQPKIIIIDQMFGFWPAGDQKDRENFKQVLTENPIVAVGSFVYPLTIPSREPLRLEREEFRLENLVGRDFSIPSWLNPNTLKVYGPQSEIQDLVAHVGHIVYPGEGYIYPLIRVSLDRVVPHLAFAVADHLKIQSQGIYNQQQVIPTDRLGRVRVNFSPVDYYFGATRSLKSTLHLAHEKIELTSVNPGDIVLIIPELYTGNHDVLDTPVGRIPGGFVVASVINSVVTGEWLAPIGNDRMLGTLLIALATTLGILSGPVVFWPMFVVLLVLLTALPLFAFSYFSLTIAWFYPVLAVVFSALSSYAARISWWMLENRRLRNALKGTIPETKLQAILDGQGQLFHEPSERTVTLLFLDIANFSTVAEQSTPKAVFMDLKNLMRDVTKIVHKYGGTIDKTLGDGMLAFFGYSYDGEISENQADQAIQCAVELQKYNLRRCFDAAVLGRAILPFRIGINTAPVYIGDIGNEDRIDFTVIGSGVNQAQRLESACEQHKIMLSASTMSHAKLFSQVMPGFTRRYIAVKHHHDLVEVIEYDPFHDDHELHSAAIREFRKSLRLERREFRWVVQDPRPLSVLTDFGPGTILDFSESGICLKIDRYLSKGIVFDLQLESSDSDISILLEQKGLSSLKAEVRWGRSLDHGFSHGLKFINLSDAQLASLFEVLSSLFGKSTSLSA